MTPTRQPSAQPTAPTTKAPNADVLCSERDTIAFAMTINPCNAGLNDTFVMSAPNIIRSLLDPGNSLSLIVTVTPDGQNGNACDYRVTVAHSSGTWLCNDLAASKMASPSLFASATKTALTTNNSSFASVTVDATPATVTTAVAPNPEPESPIPFSPYVIIIPAVIVVVLFGVCLWMWCARPKIKRQERPVFDGFEMGDAQQLESSSNLEFAVPEVEFEDPRGGSKHRLTIN
jgi:hypothetical protein